MGSLSNACHVKAKAMLNFLERMRAGRNSQEAINRVADFIVRHFKEDLKEMGVVRDYQVFSGRLLHGCISDAQTADEYVRQVLIPDRLPSIKAFPKTALTYLGSPL